MSLDAGLVEFVGEFLRVFGRPVRCELTVPGFEACLVSFPDSAPVAEMGSASASPRAGSDSGVPAAGADPLKRPITENQTCLL